LLLTLTINFRAIAADSDHNFRAIAADSGHIQGDYCPDQPSAKQDALCMFKRDEVIILLALVQTGCMEAWGHEGMKPWIHSSNARHMMDPFGVSTGASVI